jgi:anti-sigma28 factor (negative regulator of flagellin synthesis)
MLGTEDLAALARKLREEADLTPERAALLNRLEAEIRAGEFSVDTERLADRLLNRLEKPRIDPDEHRSEQS